MEYSIILPAYNEEARILESLKKLRAYFSKTGEAYEIIVVNDGSKDRTRKIVKKFSKKNREVQLLNHITNKGKGAAIKTGFSKANGKRIVFCDADLATPPKDVHRLLKELSTCDIAIASRYLPESKIIIPYYRTILSKVYNQLTKILFKHSFTDTQCGFKAFKKSVKSLVQQVKSDYYTFDVEMLINAKKSNLKIEEVPIKWKHNTGTSLKGGTPFKILLNTIKLRVTL